MTQSIDVIGAGPAGSAAAIAALSEGCAVRLFEKARFPRHKVCGEFLSPETAGLLHSLGVWDCFERLGPAVIRRFSIHLGSRTRKSALPERAYGISRYALDRILVDRALSLGAVLVRERAAPGTGARSVVIASGRPGIAKPGNRRFGFKAHFRGPAGDGVDLYFFEGCYVGVSCVEGGVTNVCGLAQESALRGCGFDMDAMLARSLALAERIRPLTRFMPWLTTGPVAFSGIRRAAGGQYAAGDALGFTDPFTGTGILNALLSGRLAGIAAARELPGEQHLSQCRRKMSRAYAAHSVLRAAISSGWAESLLPLVPAAWLFRMTRPRST